MSKWRKWERQLQAVFSEIDVYLEETYGELYDLHPRRPERGKTANNAMDGLFNIGANFSLGIGSELGEGYVIETRIVTLEDVPNQVREQIMEEVVEMLNAKLPVHFPGRNLQARRDGNLYKIVGDLSL